jgi:murein L,D-transpeptidase YcbB/YkuD
MYRGDVKEFYGYRQFHFAWYDSDGLSEQANNLYNHLNNLELEGITASVPYIDKLDSLLNDPVPAKEPDPDLEILLSAEYFFYAHKVWQGIPEQKTNKLAWFLPRKKLNLPYMMDSLLRDTSASIFSDNYSSRQYNLLKIQLRKYRQLDSSGTWKQISTTSGALKKNDSAGTIRDIRHRLYLYGDLDKDSGIDHFDESLELAVKSFQGRYGMAQNGVMGAEFFREFNMPVRENIRKLIINMERARWLPIIRDQQFLVINIPSFTLSAFDQDTLTFKMNVVVGRAVHQTVVFNGEIKYIVFSPYWNVPASIMKKEILPAIRKNPTYLKKNNMEWAGNGIRQKPGPSNSLGLVKFLFPNSYNIYLHDSPAKSLFGKNSRAFSHGCIRLAEAKKLAVYLLKSDPQWNEEKITKAMHAGKEKYVTLSHPVPVFIGYMTAWVDSHGKLNFRNDIYKRDKPLADMLFQN